MNEHLKESVNDLREVQKTFEHTMRENAENSESVKEGRSTVEEEMNSLANVLFNGISETSIKILQDPEITKIFDIISKDLKIDTVKALVNLLAVTMTYSAYNAINFYDDLLKVELKKNFENVVKRMNETTGTIVAHHEALEVFRKRLGEIENNTKIAKFKDQNKIVE